MTPIQQSNSAISFKPGKFMPLLLWLSLILVLGSCSTKKSTEESATLELDTIKLPQTKERLAELKSLGIKNKWTFTPSYTPILERELAMITGARAPEALVDSIKFQNNVAGRFLREFRNLPRAAAAPDPKASFFDWRQHDGVTPVKDQGLCGSCWVFGAHGAFEGAWRIQNAAVICSSEQNSLDCNGTYDCKGGWPSAVFNYLKRKGSDACADYPYVGVQTKCAPKQQPYKVAEWGYVGTTEIPTDQELKQALTQFGPLTVGVVVTNEWGSYGDDNGVFNVCDSGPINHIVTLIGWDDSRSAWLIKNSWGTQWGGKCGFGNERGFMWLQYGCSRIGYGAIWTVTDKKPA